MRRYKLKPTTWFCTECARSGRPNVYVKTIERKCPYGHARKGNGRKK